MFLWMSICNRKNKMMRVVNLYKEKYDVYIGRRGRGQDGYFGSPIIIGSPCPMCNNTHKDNGSTLPCYKQYLEIRIRKDDIFRKRLLALKGKVLGCFCKPKPCHGDVIVEFCKTFSLGRSND